MNPQHRFERQTFYVGDCIVWTGATDAKGYGIFGIKDGERWTSIKAHRFAYEQRCGQVPAGLQLDHLCRVRCCVNPAHLEAVTLQENVARGATGICNRSKTHCPNGHIYDHANTYQIPTGGRGCKECRRVQLSASRKRRKEYVP